MESSEKTSENITAAAKESRPPNRMLSVLFVTSACVLVLSGTLKMIEGIVHETGPVVPLSLVQFIQPSEFALVAGFIEFVVAAILFSSRSVLTRTVSLGLLVCAFGFYRTYFYATVGAKLGCSCLGGGIFIPEEYEGKVASALLLLFIVTCLLGWREWKHQSAQGGKSEESKNGNPFVNSETAIPRNTN